MRPEIRLITDSILYSIRSLTKLTTKLRSNHQKAEPKKTPNTSRDDEMMLL